MLLSSYLAWLSASPRLVFCPMAMGVLLLTSCAGLPKGDAQPASNAARNADAPASVETAIAQTGNLETAIEYTGTTAPVRVVSLRAQTEGRLLQLNVDVGDAIRKGDALGQVDSRLLRALVNQERAELAALESEVAQAEAEVSDARTQVEQARVELQQAQTDAARLQSLSREGAITTQAAEQAVTTARTAEQTLRSAQEQVRTRQQAVVAAQRRVTAQQATLAEVQAREAFASLTAPITGSVVAREVEPGDLLQPGDEVLQLGDFSAIKVVVQVSELALGSLRVGQTAQVRLDAFPDQNLSGEISRISPAADPTARLIPIEITIPNAGERISSGLLARVQFTSTQSNQVIVPERALTVSGQPEGEASQSTQLFVLQGSGEQAKVAARPVQIGEKRNGQVEIRSGLRAGETFVIRSSKPLADGQSVRLSILSEGSETEPAQSPKP